jgi:pilus assembly protein CpaE
MAERPSPTASRRITPLSLPSTAARSRSDRGQEIAVYGSRADAGIATIAAALALAFRSLGSDDVGLAELDLRRAGSRGRTPRTVAADALVDGAERIVIPGADAALVKREDGVWTLAMMRARTAAVSDAKAVSITIDSMRERFPMNVAALGHQVNERTLAAFDAADRIVLVTEGAVPSLRGMQRVLRLFRRLNYPDEKMCVVVHRFDAPGALGIPDISAALRREVFWKIPSGSPGDLTPLATKLLER